MRGTTAPSSAVFLKLFGVFITWVVTRLSPRAFLAFFQFVISTFEKYFFSESKILSFGKHKSLFNQ